MKTRALFTVHTLLLLSTPARACAVCFGDGKSNMVASVWPGVYLLLGLVGLMFVPIIWLGRSWMRRERQETG